MSTPFDPQPAGALLVNPASEKSVNYLRDLMLDKAASEPGVDMAYAEARVDHWFSEGRDQAEVSFHIDRLRREGYTGSKYRQRETKQVLDHDLPQIPEGRYALPTLEGAENEIAFYKVDHGTGRWEGTTFVSRQEGPNERSLGRDGSRRILRRIAEFGPREASLLYGQNIGRCGICHLPLTNKLSRELGIGPDCRAKLGW